MLLKKIKIPAMIGEFLIGIIISPYLLGGIGFTGFKKGLFPYFENGIGISYELFGLSIISAIVVFFIIGLQTDLSVFNKFSPQGIKISIISFILTFIGSLYVSSIIFNTTMYDSKCIILSLIFSAGSIGIASRILNRKSKASPYEKLTMFSSILMDNTITLILSTFIISFLYIQAKNANDFLTINKLSTTYVELVAIWIALLAFSIFFAILIPKILKFNKNLFSFSLLILAVIFIVSGFGTIFGIPHIIFAYIIGLVIAKTNLNFIIRENIRFLYKFFSPIFFVTMGMMIDIKSILLNPYILKTGIMFAVILIFIRIIFNLIPSLFMKFNLTGALRISLANIPRFEVSLIIATIAYYLGFLNKDFFDITIICIIMSSLIASPLLYLSTMIGKAGISEKSKCKDTKEIKFDFSSPELTNLIMYRLINNLKSHGFLVNLIETETKYFQIVNDQLFFCIQNYDTSLILETSEKNYSIVKSVIDEVIIDVNTNIELLLKEKDEHPKTVLKPHKEHSVNKFNISIENILDEKDIIINLKANNKTEILEEMIDMLYSNGRIKDKHAVLEDVMEREKTMSTGMQQGIAIPHCKSKEIDEIIMAVGLKKEGVNFDSIDGKPTKIFILLLTPEGISGPHIRVLMLVSSILSKESERERLLSLTTPKEIYDFFVYNKFIEDK
jgi:fructose-specific phosphotransferase system IIA component